MYTDSHIGSKVHGADFLFIPMYLNKSSQIRYKKPCLHMAVFRMYDLKILPLKMYHSLLSQKQDRFISSIHPPIS